MTPPIEGITITSENVKNLTDEEMDIVVVEKQQRLSANLGETKETIKEHLLNKPNMTIKDKEGMQKAIDYLVEHTMDTSENFEKLDAIVYTSEYIKIGGIKRAREDLSVQPDNVDIFQRNNTTRFRLTEETIKQQNDLLAQQGMQIPLERFYEVSIRTLPGEYSKKGRYAMGGNILALILNMPPKEGDFESYISLSPASYPNTHSKDTLYHLYRFDALGGTLGEGDILYYSSSNYPIRPVFK